jgi:hypothetical protein
MAIEAIDEFEVSDDRNPALGCNVPTTKHYLMLDTEQKTSRFCGLRERGMPREWYSPTFATT